ncbi:hypothetical protein GGR51DRAFT_507943 [Nemania sp. FL0031]|nr:hypothetical protein GGR51DRAFT_507943 [Nemania sp. FL0031]
MRSVVFIENKGRGPQNTIAAGGHQANNNGSGTQNNYYGTLSGLQASETEDLLKEKEDCLRSLIFENINTRRQNIDDALLNTCDWLLNATEFKEWWNREHLSTHNGVLWIKGKPGAGKSTLMKHILHYCEKTLDDHLIIAYFFNARGGILEKTPLGMFRSFVYQLLTRDDALFQIFIEDYREKLRIHDEGRWQWEQSELKEFIRSKVVEPQPQSKPLLLFVDALDECNEEHVRDVVSFLESLSVKAIQVGVKLRICLSSRHYPRVSMRKTLEITVERREEHGEDIDTYVGEKLLIDNRDIKRQVREKAEGIFMWVILVVAILNKACDEGRDNHDTIRKTLEEVPGDLEGVFNSLLGKNDSDRAELVRMFQWVMFSERPLSPEEFYIASVGETLPSRQAIQRRITNSSKGLIEVRRSGMDNEFVQFIHLSVGDFLYRNRRFQTLDPTLEPDSISTSHARLWNYCWSYFGHMNIPIGRGDRVMERNDLFMQYAAEYALTHANKALSHNRISRAPGSPIVQWLTTPSSWALWRKFNADHEIRLSPTETDLTPLYVFIYGHYQHLVEFAVENGANVNAQCGYYGNVLQAAACFGNGEAIGFLLKNGAKVNARGKQYDGALQAAIYSRRYAIAKLLLDDKDADADPNAQGGEFGNVLQAAVQDGNYNTVKLLLEKGARVNATGGYYGNALHAAACCSTGEMIELLLNWGANPNAQSRHSYRNALQAASYYGKYEAVKLLLQYGADVNAQGGLCSNALQAASGPGTSRVKRLLLVWGAIPSVGSQTTSSQPG